MNQHQPDPAKADVWHVLLLIFALLMVPAAFAIAYLAQHLHP